MRALVVEPGPHFSVLDVHRGIVSGLNANGVTVASFNLGDRLDFYVAALLERDGEIARAFDHESACLMAAQGIDAAAWKFAPDVAIVVSSFFVPPETFIGLRRRGVHVVLWCTESPYEDERQIRQAGYADTVILNDPVNIDEFRAVNPRTFYIPHSYDPRIHHDRGRTDEYPFSFVGTGYTSRIEFFEKAELPAGSVFAGNWQAVPDGSPLKPLLMHNPGECIDNVDTAELYRASVCSANLYRKEAMSPDLVDGWALGPREVESVMCGVFLLREPRGEGDELFPHLPRFTTPAELSDQLQWALANPDARSEAVRKAQAAVADRTFEGNVAQFLRIIGY